MERILSDRIRKYLSDGLPWLESPLRQFLFLYLCRTHVDADLFYLEEISLETVATNGDNFSMQPWEPLKVYI
jgi:hypothetical protein